MELDHARAIRSAEYREIVADQLAGLEPGGTSRMVVTHRASGECCDTQSWPETLHRLLELAAERRQLGSVVLR